MMDPKEQEQMEWEAEVLITQLLELMLDGAITWECVSYSPPMLVEAGELFMSQTLTVQTEYEGDSYRAVITDTMDVAAGEGSVDLDIIIGEEPETREESLERHLTFFPEDKACLFASLMYVQLKDALFNSPSWSEIKFAYQRFEPEVMTYPLAVLGKDLYEHRQAGAFHRICSDEKYRNDLIAEQSASFCGTRSQCCCFTGHRPEKLTAPENLVRRWLDEKIRTAVTEGYSTFITGMARGVDLWAGESVLQLKAGGLPIHLVCASPYPGFEARWAEKWRSLYHKVLAEADDVVYICPSYSYDCFQKRNEWMIDHSSRVIAVYNGSSGGTKNTLDYARKHDCKVIL